jgi:hypothetical protein
LATGRDDGDDATREADPARQPGETDMLALRPGCECCDRDLPPDSEDARICSFECTFCADCAATMNDRCPNCGGELVRRPRRPADRLAKYPASTERIWRPDRCGRGASA